MIYENKFECNIENYLLSLLEKTIFFMKRVHIRCFVSIKSNSEKYDYLTIMYHLEYGNNLPNKDLFDGLWTLHRFQNEIIEFRRAFDRIFIIIYFFFWCYIHSFCDVKKIIIFHQSMIFLVNIYVCILFWPSIKSH